jgi:hypothetical protein
MFFFSGFGSILPYLAYLTAIWICILFGYRISLFEKNKAEPADVFVAFNSGSASAPENLYIFSSEAGLKAGNQRQSDGVKPDSPGIFQKRTPLGKTLPENSCLLLTQEVAQYILLRAPPEYIL